MNKNHFSILFLSIFFICAALAAITCTMPLDIDNFLNDSAVKGIINSTPPDNGGDEYDEIIGSVDPTEELRQALSDYNGDGSRNNETWSLEVGNYDLQVWVDGKTLTLVGKNQDNVVIRGPSDYSTLTSFSVTDSDASGAVSNVIGLININGGNVTLRNLSIEGNTTEFHSKQPALMAAPAALAGIGIVGATVVIENVTVNNIVGINGGTSSGAQRVYGILAAGSSTNLTIRNSTITYFQKNGVHVLANVGNVYFTGNTVTGSAGNFTAAQNGIVLFNGHAQIDNNTFSNFRWDKPDPVAVATAILVWRDSNNIGFFDGTFQDNARSNNTFTNINNLWVTDNPGPLGQAQCHVLYGGLNPD